MINKLKWHHQYFIDRYIEKQNIESLLKTKEINGFGLTKENFVFYATLNIRIDNHLLDDFGVYNIINDKKLNKNYILYEDNG